MKMTGSVPSATTAIVNARSIRMARHSRIAANASADRHHCNVQFVPIFSDPGIRRDGLLRRGPKIFFALDRKPELTNVA